MRGIAILASTIIMVIVSVYVNTSLAMLTSNTDRGLVDLTREDKVVDFVELSDQDEYVYSKYDAMFMLMNNIEDPNFTVKIENVTLQFQGFNTDLPVAEVFKQIAKEPRFVAINENARYKYTQKTINNQTVVEFIKK